MTRLRPGAAAAAVAACALWDPGVPAAGAAGLLVTALLLVADAFNAYGGAGRYLPPLITEGSCTALVAAVLVLPAATSVLVVVAGFAALIGAFRLACSGRARRPR
ncbi:hypothetical protein ETD83_18580 [Actinomadura soli]|uniref:Uncharacterized protein n=1 Tax=Actinomadura soli TaxID=2508997 RepID=A0A5C4JBE1_9ACTN|nr:hypothetical protein [Actinomadura soli]TMQ99106.1 hypothetical protein ETD83_18580 [Actinomadura soli]